MMLLLPTAYPILQLCQLYQSPLCLLLSLVSNLIQGRMPQLVVMFCGFFFWGGGSPL